MTFLISLIRYCMAAWYGALSVQLKNKINSMIKVAMKTIGHKSFPQLQTISEERVVVLASNIPVSLPYHIFWGRAPTF